MQASQVELPSKRGECSSPCDGGESRSSNIVRHGYRLSVGEVLKWLKRAVLKIVRSRKRRKGSSPFLSVLPFISLSVCFGSELAVLSSLI